MVPLAEKHHLNVFMHFKSISRKNEPGKLNSMWVMKHYDNKQESGRHILLTVDSKKKEELHQYKL